MEATTIEGRGIERQEEMPVLTTYRCRWRQRLQETRFPFFFGRFIVSVVATVFLDRIHEIINFPTVNSAFDSPKQ